MGYKKRISFYQTKEGRSVSLYTLMESGHRTKYFVYQDRRLLQTFDTKPLAEAFCRELTGKRLN